MDFQEFYHKYCGCEAMEWKIEYKMQRFKQNTVL